MWGRSEYKSLVFNKLWVVFGRMVLGVETSTVLEGKVSLMDINLDRLLYLESSKSPRTAPKRASNSLPA